MIAGTLCFVLGLCCGAAIMALAQCMRSDELQELIDLSEGHDDA